MKFWESAQRLTLIMLVMLTVLLGCVVGLTLAYANLARLQTQLLKQNALIDRLTSENTSILHEIRRIEMQIEQHNPTVHAQ